MRFYERRARRILPALFVVMAASMPFAWLWLLPNDMEDFSQSLVAVPLFVSNILFWGESGYFDTAAELKPLLHTWSLAVEEQYYVLFPLFIMLTWRWGKRWVAGLLVAAAASSLSLAQWGAYNQSAATFFLLPTRGWELAIGALIAFYFSQRQRADVGDAVKQVASSAGLLLILYGVFAFSKSTPFPSLYALLPTTGAALIILFATPTTVVGTVLGSKAFVGIGLVSYSAYLWHQPLFAFARHRSLNEPSELLLAVLALAVIALAFLSWKYVETPFRNRQRFSRKEILIYGALGSTFFVAVGLIGDFNKGFEKRFDLRTLYEGDVGHLVFHKHVSDMYYTCTPGSVARQALKWEGFIRCMQSRQDASVNIALVGDSHAEHLFLGLAENLDKKNVAFYIKASYPFLGNPEFENIFSHILRSESIDTVLLTMHWASRSKRIPKNTTLEMELLRTLNALMDAGKTVYLIDDVPRFHSPPERCKFVGADFGKPVCDTEKSNVLEREKTYLPALRKVVEALPEVRLISLRDHLCDETKCSMVRNGVLMYRDNHHLNILGSQYIGTQIVTHYPELNQ
jgi:peptidoglycan/LPS O-acetylase OafA/YrhL